MLTGKGITAWRRALTHLAPAAGLGPYLTPATPASPPRPRRLSTLLHQPGQHANPARATAATRPQALPPEPVTTELIHALAGLAVALAGT